MRAPDCRDSKWMRLWQRLGFASCQAHVTSAPADPKDLKAKLGGAVRHLGEAGKKRGVITTLPIALGLLQSAGEIRRVPVNGRLDQQRYQYVRFHPNPLAGNPHSHEEVAHELATRFFRWAAPATTAQLGWWAGMTVKMARSAAAALKLLPLSPGDDRLLSAEDLDALRAFSPPPAAHVSLAGSLDNLFHLRREIATTLDPADAGRAFPTDKKQAQPSTLVDLPHHAIVDRGRLIGLWDFDVASNSIARVLLGESTSPIEIAIARMERFVRDDLGDARSFSLDSPESRTARIASLRSRGSI